MNPGTVDMIRLLQDLRTNATYAEQADRLIAKLLNFVERDVDMVMEKISKITLK